MSNVCSIPFDDHYLLHLHEIGKGRRETSVSFYTCNLQLHMHLSSLSLSLSHTHTHTHAAADTNEEGLASTLEAIAKLPPSNKDTLAYLILHLQRVAYHSTANKMPLANLVTVFAPTVVGNGSAKPTDADLLRDAKQQPKVSVFQENDSLSLILWP